MRSPNDAVAGSGGGFHLRTEKQEDGTWKATASAKGVAPVVKPTEVEAIRAMTKVLADHHAKVCGMSSNG